MAKLKIGKSIRHSAGVPPQPGYCNLGTLLRALCWANALLLAWAVARSGSPAELAAAWLPGAGLVEPVSFLALATLCAARRVLLGLGAAARCLVSAVVTSLLTLLALSAARQATLLVDDLGMTQPVVLMAAGAALIEHLLGLQHRALAPAAAEARLDALQARIRPHFLFNSLNAVLALIGEDPVRAERILEGLAELFRALLGDHRRLVPIDGELDLCRRYLAIEQERLGTRLRVDWQVRTPLPEAWLPPLLLQPLVENAVIHGIEPFPPEVLAGLPEESGFLRIEVSGQQGRLRIAIENPVLPTSDATALPVRRSGSGSGLANVRERLALHFDAEAALDVQAASNRFRVLLYLPLGEPP